MEIHNYPFTDIYRRNNAEHLIELIFLNKNKPQEALVFLGFSFYLINITATINLEGFVHLPAVEKNKDHEHAVMAIHSTDIQDIIYIKLDNGHMVVMTHTFDNYSGDAYMTFRICTKEDQLMTPLNITEYEVVNGHFESGIP